MRRNIKTAIVWGAAFVPSLTLAANIGSMDFKGFIYFIISDFLQPLVIVFFSLAIVYFLWNIAEVIRKSGDPKELATLKTKAFWGVIAIFVMGSLYGLVQILVNTFIGGSSGGVKLQYENRQYPYLDMQGRGTVETQRVQNTTNYGGFTGVNTTLPNVDRQWINTGSQSEVDLNNPIRLPR